MSFLVLDTDVASASIKSDRKVPLVKSMPSVGEHAAHQVAMPGG